MASPSIRKLDEILINQINAGEVVERPAHVVKELLENSLDAGATQIEVALLDGGTREILVKDNGAGIEASEMELAIERHATSKLQTADDLTRVASFGFRGEALASIASVSKMRLRSSTDSREGGAEITVDFGVASKPYPAARAQGTSVWVYDIFEKTPARKKFLRSAQTELAYIVKVIKESALAHPSVSFQVYHQGDLLHSYPANDEVARFWSCLKPQWEALEVRDESSQLKLMAYLSPPSHQDERSEMFLYINQRPVRNKTLLAAVRNAYLDNLGPGHEPSGAIFLSMDYSWVDVNAHPQKLEVRCVNQEKLYPWLYHSVSKAIGAHLAKFPLQKREEEASESLRCVGKLKDRYLVYLHPEGLEIVDSNDLKAKDGRKLPLRVVLSDIEKHFHDHS